MGCNAVEDFVLAPGQSDYLIDSIVVTERPDWTTCCKECTITESCKSWVLLLDGEEGICFLYLIESPALTSLGYSISSTRASFFGTRGYSDEPLDGNDCPRDTIWNAAWPDDNTSTEYTSIVGMCSWEKMWCVRVLPHTTHPLRSVTAVSVQTQPTTQSPPPAHAPGAGSHGKS